MKQYLIKVPDTPDAQFLLNLIIASGYFKIKEQNKIPNKTTLNAMKDAEQGKVTKTKNVADLINKLSE